jgi:hypothetical protein
MKDVMKEEIKKYLKEELEISLDKDYDFNANEVLTVSVLLEGEVITTSDPVTISTGSEEI